MQGLRGTSIASRQLVDPWSVGAFGINLEAPLIGRCEAAGFAVDVLHAPEKGGVVLVGVGKTRLAREALGRAAREGARVIGSSDRGPPVPSLWCSRPIAAGAGPAE
jgi:hypothetical protein